MGFLGIFVGSGVSVRLTWVPVGPYEVPAVPYGHCGSLWGGAVWGHIYRTVAFLWCPGICCGVLNGVTVCFFGSLWILMGSLWAHCVFLWAPVGPCRSVWGLYGSLCVSVPPQPPLRLHAHRDRVLVWAAEAVRTLRERHRMWGALVGAPSRRGGGRRLPLQLLPEEGRLLEEIGAARLEPEPETRRPEVGGKRPISCGPEVGVEGPDVGSKRSRLCGAAAGAEGVERDGREVGDERPEVDSEGQEVRSEGLVVEKPEVERKGPETERSEDETDRPEVNAVGPEVKGDEREAEGELRRSGAEGVFWARICGVCGSGSPEPRPSPAPPPQRTGSAVSGCTGTCGGGGCTSRPAANSGATSWCIPVRMWGVGGAMGRYGLFGGLPWVSVGSLWMLGPLRALCDRGGALWGPCGSHRGLHGSLLDVYGSLWALWGPRELSGVTVVLWGVSVCLYGCL